MHDSQLNVAAVVGDGYSAVDLPYAGGDLSDEGGDLSMLVVVPDAGNYAAIESDFGTDFVASVDASLERQTVDLALPRFESDSAINLKDVIEDDLGIAGLFDTPGGLVGIGTTRT